MKILIVAVLMMASTVFSQPEWMEKGRHDGLMRGRHDMLEQLKLTDEQEKQFEKLHVDLQKNQIALRAKMQSLRVDLGQAYRSDKPDRSKVESIVSDIGKLQTELKLNHIGLWFDVNKILDADQQKLWKEHRGMMGKKEGPMFRGKRPRMREFEREIEMKEDD